MASPVEHMSEDEPETHIDSDQAKVANDDHDVQTEPSRFAPPFPEQGVTSRVPNLGDTDDPADVNVDKAAAHKTAGNSVAVCSDTAAGSVTDKNAADKVVTDIAVADEAVHNVDESEITADEDAAVESIAVTANVEGVRQGGKAPEVFGGETLNADAPSDSGMPHVRVSIHGSLSLVAHTHVMLCVSQEKSQESS
jgi:hypothetical protein